MAAHSSILAWKIPWTAELGRLLSMGSQRVRQEKVGSHQKKIPHVQGQRRSPKKTGGGEKSHLDSNPITARDARRAQTKPCAHQDILANIPWIIEKAKEFQKKSTSASLTILKVLTLLITTNCGKFFKKWEYQTTLPAS